MAGSRGSSGRGTDRVLRTQFLSLSSATVSGSEGGLQPLRLYFLLYPTQQEKGQSAFFLKLTVKVYSFQWLCIAHSRTNPSGQGNVTSWISLE